MATTTTLTPPLVPATAIATPESLVSPPQGVAGEAARAAAPIAILDVLAATADQTRLRILNLLRHDELAVGEIAHLLEQSQPRVSRHVRLLEEAGLAERRREGSWVFVRLGASAQCGAMLTAIDALTPSPGEVTRFQRDRHRLTVVQAERSAAAARFFAAHAPEWDAMRSLHVAEAEVEVAITAALAPYALGHMLDIGTGTGRMADILRSRATRITALDRSPEMLRIARSKLGFTDGAPLDLVHGDLVAMPLADASIDSAIMHQVLHYASAPQAAIAEAARVLKPGAPLLIVDFAPHQQEELRREAGHVRLGFADSQIRDWFVAEHFALESVAELTGGALTVKLWLGRRRRARATTPNATRKAD